MLSRIKKDGFKPLILKYYENFEEKEIPSKYELYSDKEIFNEEIIPHFFSPFCYESFELILSDFALIPETCFNYSIAIPDFNKCDNKTIVLKGQTCNYILYKIPNKVFLKGLTKVKSDGRDILIATKEKALLDYIFVAIRDFNNLTDFDDFFENYRFDLDEFMLLDFNKLKEIGKFYDSPRINLFLEYLDKGEFNFDCWWFRA